MKRIILILSAFLLPFLATAQIVNSEDFENFSGEGIVLEKNGKIDFIESALSIKELYGLDKSNSISRTTIIEAEGLSREKIYIEVNNWFVHSFNSGKSVIQLNDKDAGVVIGKGYISNVSNHTSMTTNSIVNAWVIIRIDIREDKFRVMTTIQEYEIEMGQGVIGAMSSTGNQMQTLKWLPQDCFPFDSKKYKKTTAKAFVKCHIWSQIIIDKLTEAVLYGITGTEDEW